MQKLILILSMLMTINTFAMSGSSTLESQFERTCREFKDTPMAIQRQRLDTYISLATVNSEDEAVKLGSIITSAAAQDFKLRSTYEDLNVIYHSGQYYIVTSKCPKTQIDATQIAILTKSILEELDTELSPLLIMIEN